MNLFFGCDQRNQILIMHGNDDDCKDTLRAIVMSHKHTQECMNTKRLKNEIEKLKDDKNQQKVNKVLKSVTRIMDISQDTRLRRDMLTDKKECQHLNHEHILQYLIANMQKYQSCQSNKSNVKPYICYQHYEQDKRKKTWGRINSVALGEEVIKQIDKESTTSEILNVDGDMKKIKIIEKELLEKCKVDKISTRLMLVNYQITKEKKALFVIAVMSEFETD